MPAPGSRLTTREQRAKLERIRQAQEAYERAYAERVAAVLDGLQGDEDSRLSKYRIGRYGLGKDAGSVDAIVAAADRRQAQLCSD